jgi:hypothetical protein
MLAETIVWIVCIGLVTYKYDLILQNYSNKMSDSHHFLIFSFIIICCFYVLYNFFLLENKKKLMESIIWIIFITTMSTSCRNRLGEDLDSFHFLLFSLVIFYCIYIYRQIYPKEEQKIIEKIIVVFLIVIKILGPTISYLWPYGVDYPDDFDWTGWPDDIDL